MCEMRGAALLYLKFCLCALYRLPTLPEPFEDSALHEDLHLPRRHAALLSSFLLPCAFRGATAAPTNGSLLCNSDQGALYYCWQAESGTLCWSAIRSILIRGSSSQVLIALGVHNSSRKQRLFLPSSICGACFTFWIIVRRCFDTTDINYRELLMQGIEISNSRDLRGALHVTGMLSRKEHCHAVNRSSKR
ncbi:unnamed protein product [Trypanosoma congolense IL3000]|uniref:WGS project CAEQ00000000 data, annotated contig 2181 n=1 Tax=Trypanosoma congolense (strain IL3000) TaxID=1068625 RepID=F9WC39_TRYCI|nr:unnamed protein product [Trypanosoma congolense IL3000]